MGSTYWDKLVEEHGLEGAREIARSYTRRRKTSGFAAMTSEQRSKLASMGGKARQAQIAEASKKNEN